MADTGTADLQATVLELQKRLRVLEDKEAIRALMSRRAYYHTAFLQKEELELFWSKREDVEFEAEEFGTLVGYESIYRRYVEGTNFPHGTPGAMIDHALTTEVIEIAGDAQTAKGVWISPGHETFPVRQPPLAQWSWIRYACDFIREKGEWRIWHMHVLTTFRTPFNQDWVDRAINPPQALKAFRQADANRPGPDRGVSFNQPYRTDEGRRLYPVPPRPYETWEDTWSATELYTEDD